MYIKIFYSYLCIKIDVSNGFNSINSVNQAIQHKEVRPLSYKRYIGSVVTMYVEIGSGTSMVGAPGRVSARARKVSPEGPCMLPHCSCETN